MLAVDLTADLSIGVLSSIIASALVAVAVFSYRTPPLSRWIGRDRPTSLPSVGSSNWNRLPLRHVLRRLMTRLRQDQSRTGLHAGQFGRSASGEEKWQTGLEDIQVKPRIYHTLWPVAVLTANRLLRGNRRYAVDCIRRLFVRDRVRVYQAAVTDMPTTGQPQIISYRHTMGAALILRYADPRNSIVRDVLSAMIDLKGRWQNDDGGWAQCDKEVIGSDLWGSAYAARLLDAAIEDQGLIEQERQICVTALNRTISYFRTQWAERHWAYGGSKAEENAVLILIELAPLLAKHDRPFLGEVVAAFKAWLTPLGRLSDGYLDRLEMRDEMITAYARMGFAFRRAEEEWIPLYAAAMEHLNERANAAELAFLIEMTCALIRANGRATLGMIAGIRAP